MNNKPIIDKLIIFDYPSTRPATYTEYHYSCGSKGCGWSGITQEQSKTLPVKETYEGDAAIIKTWEIHFDQLDKQDKALIRAVFPDIDRRSKLQLKSPQEIAKIATIKSRKIFGITCTRCGGDGNYARAVAFTRVDNGICHKCGGRGKVLPRLTNKVLREISNYFGGEK